MKLNEVINILEGIAPPYLAYPNDRIGLMVGDINQEINRITITVDATESVINKSIQNSAQLIVSHHALFYSPLYNLQYDKYPQSHVIKLIKSDIALYVMHTNFDIAEGGINDSLADKFHLINTKPLIETRTEKIYKITVYSPPESAESLIDALTSAGAGLIGNYSRCNFQSKGIGSFIPGSEASPYIGSANKPESIEEIRIEMQADESHLNASIEAIKAVHPYEEPVFDIYPLVKEGKKSGLGTVGCLKAPIKFGELCSIAESELGINELRTCGNKDSIVHKIAVLGGSGAKEMHAALESGADVFITGEVMHNIFLEAAAYGLNIIDAGHFNTERPGMQALTNRLSKLNSFSNIAIDYLDAY